MDDKELDELFRSRLDDFEMVPSPKVWNTIDDELNAGKRKRILLPLLGIAASIIILISAGLLFIPQGTKINSRHLAEGGVVKIKMPVPVIAKATNTVVPATEQAKNTVARQHLTTVAVNRVANVHAAKRSIPVARRPEQKTNEQLIITAAAEPHQQLVAVVPDEATPLTITQPAETPEAVVAKPVPVATTLPVVTKPVIALVKQRRRIHTLGDIINLAMARVDKRHDKLIEFTNTDDDDEANITGVNLGVLKIKKDK